MSRTTVTLGSESWVLDEDEITVEDGIALKYATGLNVVPMLQGVAEWDGEAMRALVWFLRFKAGEQVSPKSINFRLMDLRMEQEPDPTEGDGTPSESAATA